MLQLARDLKVRPRLTGIQPEMAFAWVVADEVYSERGFLCEITSGVEGKHTSGSKHPNGYALDFRVKHVPRTQWDELRAEIARRLGPDYDVLLELGSAPHIHVEFDPKP